VVEDLEILASRVESATSIWPARWFAIKEELEGMDADYIDLNTFRRVCRSHDVSAKRDQNIILKYLHDLGIVLNFSDLPLRDTNVINPRWITEGVYKIINSKSAAKSGGTVRISNISQILNSDRHPPEKHNYIVEIMRKFEICYQIDSDFILIPGLLPIEEPDFQFPIPDSAAIILDFDFLPKSVISRFIVRTHDDIEDGLKWRTGTVLQSPVIDARALVRVDEEENRIFLYCAGSDRRDYITILTQVFREIGNSYKELRCIEKVPLPDNQRVAVSLEHLKRLEQMGEASFVPDGASKKYDVGELLGRVESGTTKEDMIISMLETLAEKGDSEKELMEKVDESIMLRPNLFGVGVDLKPIVKSFLRKKK